MTGMTSIQEKKFAAEMGWHSPNFLRSFSSQL